VCGVCGEWGWGIVVLVVVIIITEERILIYHFTFLLVFVESDGVVVVVAGVVGRVCVLRGGGVLPKPSTITFLVFTFSRSFSLCCLIDLSKEKTRAPLSLALWSVCSGVFSCEWLFGNNFFGRGRFPSSFGAVDSPGQDGSDALSG
jgi:hypothetical protein